MFPASAYRPVQRLINRGIEGSDEATAFCRQLEGRSMRMTVDLLPLRTFLTIHVTASDGRVWIDADRAGAPDVELSGTVIELTRLLFLKPDESVHASKIELRGDAEIADQFKTLLWLARPNLQEELETFVGDELAIELSDAFERARDRAIGAAEDIVNRASDHLHEESATVVTRSEAEKFFARVDDISNDLARAEARMSRLSSRIANTGASGDQ